MHSLQATCPRCATAIKPPTPTHTPCHLCNLYQLIHPSYIHYLRRKTEGPGSSAPIAATPCEVHLGRVGGACCGLLANGLVQVRGGGTAGMCNMKAGT